ncbi:helix-turn-helix domain-containing protein [Streptomyces lavendofoliae]|uniref:helix-turn-helix domain-containing protein n=1 Tax=Streptomyces lavendofoliae TaxID=67314 RepID=UPI003D8ADDDE
MNRLALRHLRIQRGLTQEELSHQSGVSVRTIRNFESGLIERPRRKSIDLLLAVLDPEQKHLRRATMDEIRLRTGAWRGPRPAHTSLVGREDDVRELGELVLANQVVMVTGPGGVGKSRVALAAAESIGPRFAGGVAVAEMGWVPREQDLDAESAVKYALEAVHGLLTGEDGLDGLGMLLVLDNTEHLASTMPVLVKRLLDDHPTLHVLITSRRVDPLYGARIWELGLLPGEAAVQLLTDRVRMSCPILDLSDDLPRLKELAWRLDCLPRLLEFAAHRLRTAPLSALLSHQYGMKLLDSTDSSALPHQRSVQDSLRWSLDLLDERHQEVLIRLAQRPESVSFDAGGATVEDEFTTPETMDLLANLADASLLQVNRGRSYEYRMLRHVKAFLADAGAHARGSAKP